MIIAYFIKINPTSIKKKSYDPFLIWVIIANHLN